MPPCFKSLGTSGKHYQVYSALYQKLTFICTVFLMFLLDSYLHDCEKLILPPAVSQLYLEQNRHSINTFSCYSILCNMYGVPISEFSSTTTIFHKMHSVMFSWYLFSCIFSYFLVLADDFRVKQSYIYLLLDTSITLSDSK